jgi:acyl carrier protein
MEQFRDHIIATLSSIGQLSEDRVIALRGSIDTDTNFVDLEMDSLTALDFCVGLEDRIGGIVEPADLVEHPSVNALAHHLAKTRSAAA